MLDPQIFRCIALAFGLLFFFSAIHKLTYRAQFGVILANYKILPEKLIPVATILIPLLETTLAGSWVLAVFSLQLQVSMSLASAVLLTVYALVISINLLRGRRHIDCGCSFSNPDADNPSAATNQQLSGWLVMRNLLLAVVAISPLADITTREPSTMDHLFLIPAVLVLVFCYAAYNQLVLNGGAINSWRKAHG